VQDEDLIRGHGVGLGEVLDENRERNMFSVFSKIVFEVILWIIIERNEVSTRSKTRSSESASKALT